MEFINQLVAFSILMESGEGILGKHRDQVEEAWIGVANIFSDSRLIGLLGAELGEKYQAWIDKYMGPAPAASEDEVVRPNKTEPEIRREAEIVSQEVAKEEKAKAKKRRGKSVKDNKAK